MKFLTVLAQTVVAAILMIALLLAAGIALGLLVKALEWAW